MESRTKKFINDPKANALSKGGEIKVSKIFVWYGKDFYNITEFINRYAVSKVDSKAKIGYVEYDWALNE